MSRYLEKAGEDKQDLYLQCVKCLEASIVVFKLLLNFMSVAFSVPKDYHREVIGNKVSIMLKQLEVNYKILATEDQKKPSFKYLEAVAMVRCILASTAEILVSSSGSEVRDEVLLVNLVEKVCCDGALNSVVVGPGIFLVRQICKRFGFDDLKDLMKLHRWILPKELAIQDVSSIYLPLLGGCLVYSDCIKHTTSTQRNVRLLYLSVRTLPYMLK